MLTASSTQVGNQYRVRINTQSMNGGARYTTPNVVGFTFAVAAGTGFVANTVDVNFDFGNDPMINRGGVEPQGGCDAPAVTTTQPEVTTTVPEVTTTVPEVTTTVPEVTTTSDPTGVSPGSGTVSDNLPVTGPSRTTGMALMALGFLLTGFGVVALTRRPEDEPLT
jgi:LPXTG-motif cell wall-anchored protein